MSCCGSGSRDGGAKGGGLAARWGGAVYWLCCIFIKCDVSTISPLASFLWIFNVVVPCFVKCSNMDVLDHFLLPIRYQIYVKAGKIVQHFLCHINTSRESLKPAECRHIKGNEMTRLLSRCRSQPNKRPGRTETKDQILSTRINPTASVVFEEKVNNVSHLCVSRFWGERSRCGAGNSPSTLPTLISSMLEIWC